MAQLLTIDDIEHGAGLLAAIQREGDAVNMEPFRAFLIKKVPTWALNHDDMVRGVRKYLLADRPERAVALWLDVAPKISGSRMRAALGWLAQQASRWAYPY